jgi:negative modulator of initiation of replication
MKIIEVDDELYHFIASKTERIGEQASDILRRLLGFEPLQAPVPTPEPAEPVEESVVEQVKEAPEPPVEVTPPPVEPASPAATPANTQLPPLKAEKPAKKTKTRKATKKRSSDAGLEDISALKPSVKLDALAMDDITLQPNVVGRFLYILNALHDSHGDAFSDVVKIKGRDRLYFADAEETLLDSGSSTNPKQIGSTGFWVMTNSNTTRKKWMLTEVAKMLGYTESDLKILAHRLQVG